MKFASLFAGIGGFDLGFERAGMECALQVERDTFALKVLEKHYPNARRMHDVRDVRREDVDSVDVVCGGFPCQDVSVAGRRAGLAGERSGLWFEFHRILDQAKPQWVVIENVPGLLSSNDGRDFKVIIDGLVECGYRVGWRILDAQYFGVAQRRRRVFIVGSLGDGRAAQVLFEREGVPGDSKPRQAPEAGIAAPTYKGASVSRARQVDPDELVLANTVRPTANKWQADDSDNLVFRIQRSDGYSADNVDATLSARDFKSATDLIVSSIDVRNMRLNGDISGTLQAKENGGYSLNYQNPIVFDWNLAGSDRTHIVCSGDYAQLRAGGVDAVLFKSGVRRLTPTECERLQGFPDGWTGGQSDAQRYKQLGNAVCVNVAEWLGKRMMAAERNELA